MRVIKRRKITKGFKLPTVIHHRGKKTVRKCLSKQQLKSSTF
jgi:hypothetical protein